MSHEIHGKDHAVPEPENSPRLGDHRIIDGKWQFYTGILWLPYPPMFAELIRLALETGWGFDDGLPMGYRHIKAKDGTITVQPYIRLLIGREPGSIADSDDKSLGYQFHLLIPMGTRSWGKMDGYVKTSETGRWVGITGITEVRQTISQNRVIAEPVYAEANN